MVIRLQSSLGRSLKRIDSEELNIKGLVLATVSKINYKYQTVEVKTSGVTLGSKAGDDGKLAVPYPKQFSGKTPEGSIFGSKPLITEGSTVLIGFINDDINNPIILNVYSDNTSNIMINTNPLIGGKMSNDDVYKYSSALYNILPDLTYTYKDGEGTSVKTFNGKTFLSITSGEKEKPQATDFYTGTDYQDLFTSYYGNKTLIEPRIQKAPNMLFKHQGLYFDSGEADNHVTTLFISERGDIRTSVMDKETQKRTTQEMTHDGSYRVIQQNDDLLLDTSQVWVEFGINQDNQFYIKNPKQEFQFTDEGIYVNGNPLLDNLDESVADSVKMLEEVQKQLDEINYLLEGVGKENLAELIRETKNSIEVSKKASTDVQAMNNQVSQVSSRTEGIIKQFQDFRDQTFKSFYEDTSKVINEFNQNFPTMKTDVSNIKNNVNTIINTKIPTIEQSIKDIKGAQDVTNLTTNFNTLKSTVDLINSKTIPDINKKVDTKADKTYVDKIQDKVNHITGETVGALLQLSSNVTIPHNKYTTINFDTVIYNNSEFWDTTNTSRLVIPKGVSKVKVSANTLWVSNATGQRMLRILKNGTYSLGLPYTRDVAISTSPSNVTSAIIPVKEGDYFELEVFQDSGNSLDLRTDPYTWFSIEATELDTGYTSDDFMVIGHRGATGYDEEHTIKSYQLALDKGADYIELDLQLTKDNKLVCMHDSTIDRTTTGTGKISEMTLSDIQKYTTKGGEKIPSLEDVLKYFGKKVNYYIETKRPFDANMDKELLTQLKKYGLIGIGTNKYQVIIQSFAKESLVNIHNQFSNIPLVYLTSTISNAIIDEVYNSGFYAVAPTYTVLTKDVVTYAHSKGLKVHTWTVNTVDDMKTVINMGVDGMFTNYLDEYKKI